MYSGVSKEKKVVGEKVKQDQIYGFGHLQYFAYLKNLYPLFYEGEQLKLNELGEKVNSHQADFMSYATHDYYWGGTYFRDFRWNQEKNSLIRPSTPEE